FSASATEIQSGTNLNVEPDIGDQGLVWTSARKGSGYTHSDGEAGITIKDDGNYMVYANVPLRGNIARGSVGLTINLDDDYIEGARGQQGYIRDANNHKDSSIHFSGIIRAEAGQVLTVTTEQLALAGTVNVQADRAASIFIEKLRNDGLFSDQFTTTTAGENMNPANKTALALVGDGMSLDIIDNLAYSNEGDNEENIVIKKAGNYLLTFNVTLQSSGGRVNPRFTVDVNGVEVPGATSTSHYIRNANAHNESTGSFVALLSDLAVDDVVTVNTTREANTQVVTSPEGGKVALQAKASYSAAAGDTSPPKLSSIIGLGLDGFEAKIEDFGLSVDAATIKAVVDGAESTVTTSKIGSITTIAYAFASFPVPFSSHSVSLTYSDSAGNSYAKDFSFTVDVDYKSLPASFASTSVDKSAAGFIANVTQISTIQTEAANNVHGNSIANAEKQLRGEYLNPNEVDDDDNPLPYLNEADPDAWEGWSISPVEVDGVINWNQDEGAAIGNFGEDQAIPQIPGWGDSADGIVVEILGYLELSKGLHTLGVFSDDGFKLSFGPNPKDQLGIIAGQFEGWGQDVIFNIVAEADGLYPVRLLWVEGGGGANVEFFSVDDKGTKILINDPDNADAIKAYRTADTAPYISRVAPAAGELSRTIEFDFINGDLSVVKSSVKMKFNGEDATVSTSSTDDGVSVVYDHGDYLPAGTHTVELSYSESGGVDRVRNYSITVPKGRVDILMDKPKVTIEFDDLTGDSAAGAVGNPNATYINGPELGVAALYPKGVGTAVRFDGSKNTDLRITDHADINVTNGPWEERTWEFWFKPEQLPEAGAFGILFQEGGATRGINIYLYGTEDDAEPNLYMMAWNRAETLWGGAINQVGGDNITAVTARVTVGNINHLVLVMDGDASGDLEGTLTGYLNGQQVGQVSGVHMLYNHGDDTSFGNLWTNSVNHTGNGPGTGGMGFTGVIDDASFYSTALSAEQVQTHFQGGFGDLTTAEIEAWLTAGPEIPLLQSKSPTGAAAEGEETEISVSFRGIDFTDLSITVNDTAVDPTITSEDGFSTITANGAFSLGQNVITVSWNGESETWNFYQFSVAESLTGLASYSVETVGAVPGPWEFKDGVWVSEGSVAGCGGPYHDFLTSPDYIVSADGEVTLSFEHRHAFEGAMWDSGQLWISVNGGAYADVGKDAFSVNGYT
ncbi:MAG: LamG-like jellyroll fold domain-containing protein, partial [Verrucomicrobiia bacterium]